MNRLWDKPQFYHLANRQTLRPQPAPALDRNRGLSPFLSPFLDEPTETPRVYPPRAPPDWPETEQTITLDEDINQDRYDCEFDQSVIW